MRIGCETEFGILDGWSPARALQIHRRVVAGRAALRDLPRLGVFLGNGARCYIDHGRHNEYCTPECHDPMDLLASDLAGRRIMAEGARAAGLRLLLANIDYGSGATWGTHENYECRGRIRGELGHRLDTHLVTRIIFTGSGGIDPLSSGVRPVFSPRARMLRNRRGHQMQAIRALVYEKPRNFGAGLRLHVMAGESLLSHLAGYLKCATTAMVVSLLDRGIAIGPGTFADPTVQVLQRLNRDLGMARRFRMDDGLRLTALDIQWCLLEDVAGHLAKLPEWAGRAVNLWAEALGELANPADCGRPRFDWMIYHSALMQLAEECGVNPDAMRPGENHRSGGHSADGPPGKNKRLTELRAAACEFYLRLRVLGGESLFEQLDQSGALRHRLPEIDEERIQRARRFAPPGRARLRAQLVRQFGSRGTDGPGVARVRADWDQLHHKACILPIPDKATPGWKEAWRKRTPNAD